MYCLLVYKSLTHAQIAVKTLRAGGIRADLSKPPRDMVSASCSHSVTVLNETMGAAMIVLRAKKLAPERLLRGFY